MKTETWQATDRMFEKHPTMRSEPVPYQEIDAAFAENGFGLDADYREFIHRYGGAIVGPYRIYGLRKPRSMARKEGSVFDETRHFRKQGWPGTDQWLVFSGDHAGNPIGLDKDGKVWICDHDFGGIQLLENNFESYLRKWCLMLDPIE